MKNKNIFIYVFFLIFFNNLIFSELVADDQFNFDVTEVKIENNGNIFKGLKRGKASTVNGVAIEADTFEYNKLTNILNAYGNVILKDSVNKLTITSETATYFKNEEKLVTKENSTANDDKGNLITADTFEYNKLTNILNAYGNVILKDSVNKLTITSETATYFKNEEKLVTKENSTANDDKGNLITGKNFSYDKINNIFNAEGNVEVINKIENYQINSEDITYFKNQEKIITTGKTTSLVQSKYSIISKNLIFYVSKKELSSNFNTTIKDLEENLFIVDKFNYLIDSETLKGENILIITENEKPTSDKYYFSNGIIDLKNKDFVAKDPKIYVHKNIFDNSRNDPRLFGSTSIKEGGITTITNGVFTSCEVQNEKCPPWKIKAKKIKHDKNKKQLIYDHAVLELYDIPIFYYPKFFHPDPTVKRQSGFLQPRLNNSKVLGSSIYLPYYKVIDVNKDYTFKPTIFDKDILMLQNEYREVNKNSELEIDYAYIDGFKSSITKKKTSISHLFTKLKLDLNLDEYLISDINVNIEKVNNDTYLKIFDNNLTGTNLKPKDSDNLTSEIKLNLKNKGFNFNAGFKSYENLQLKNSDRYQYILPYYNFSKNLSSNFANGSINLNSKGNNNLKNTNNLRTNIINNLNYLGNDYIFNTGLKNNINIYLKNLNAVGKNDTEYKSSPSSELMSIFELTSELPLEKKSQTNLNKLTPKISLRLNPTDMKNYSNVGRGINVNNIFNINRLAMEDTLESGESLTIGLGYNVEDKVDYNKYFKIDVATVFRNEEVNEISKSTTLNKKQSNIFGSIENRFSDFWTLEYDFAVTNNLNKVEYNSINSTFSLNNFVTTFNFIEKNGVMGSANTIENSTKYQFNENNYLSFNSRRNRKLNLTEFYDLVYEYKNDCLTAGIKYRKTYYEDRELVPTEDLLFTITFYPLTTYEQEIDDNLYN
ncbi:LPS-assembly protein LptD [Candidatus Pelagibacter sp. HIMB1509]|uniref:LPS-assembly protein LptD n=1 Tax=Candidatus Pelagibacter sp. HIMB1509 TaxID=3413339 RepID=UPI003F85855F